MLTRCRSWIGRCRRALRATAVVIVGVSSRLAAKSEPPSNGVLLIAGASDQWWQCEQAESDHSQRHGNEIPGNVGL